MVKVMFFSLEKVDSYLILLKRQKNIYLNTLLSIPDSLESLSVHFNPKQYLVIFFHKNKLMCQNDLKMD